MLLAFVLTSMLALDPSADVAGLALAISDTVEQHPAPRRLAALLVAIAWYESRFRQDAVGDGGHSCGPYQSWVGPGILCERLRRDPMLATARAIQQVHASLKACASEAVENRLALYTSGSCDRGRKESRHRWWLAWKLLTELTTR